MITTERKRVIIEVEDLDCFVDPSELDVERQKMNELEDTLSQLVRYSEHKAAAMRCRLAGDIGQALRWEVLCDRIYDLLPKWAKW